MVEQVCKSGSIEVFSGLVVARQLCIPIDDNENGIVCVSMLGIQWQDYGHQARVCKNKAVCGACGGQHERRACSIPEQFLKPRCCNCQGSHPAWASICPKRQEAAKKAREAWISRPGKYEIPSSTLSTPAPQLPSTSFSLSHPLPGGKRRKTAKPTRSSDRIRGLPEVQILSTKSVTPGEKLPNIPFQIPNAEMSS